MKACSIVPFCLFLLMTLTVIKGFPHDQQMKSGESQSLQMTGIKRDNAPIPENPEVREQRILGILGNWGYGYPGFGRGAYGGSCRITGRCGGNGAYAGYERYGYGYGGYPYNY